MSDSFVIEDSSVPAGNYEAKFVGHENRVHPEYGDGILFLWEITDGKYKGRQAGRTTGPRPLTGNACGRMLSELSGSDLKDGVRVKPDDYVGKKYLIIVKATPNGKST